ncbi:hypothetical protein EJ02DRAFT_417146 [Clathrospora elynae]|uniref:Uncharacterized protein n=1 Tax=Clathrospora elynae TaxID=706981 RepID=A0A6A5T7F5_9PLEO|nr:hypothetical protein EJ02DRAFT_417146 [Clathrospora elynae]
MSRQTEIIDANIATSLQQPKKGRGRSKPAAGGFNFSNAPTPKLKGKAKPAATQDPSSSHEAGRVLEVLTKKFKRPRRPTTTGSSTDIDKKNSQLAAQDGANLHTTRSGYPAKDNLTGKLDSDSIPTFPQTSRQMRVYDFNDDAVHQEHRFINDIGMDAFQLDRSTMIFRSQVEDHILTTTSDCKGQLAFHDTTVPHCHTSAASRIVPFLKVRRHGAGGDFDDDSDRATDEGHEYRPDNLGLYEKYLENRHAFYKIHPIYSRLQWG